MAMFAERIDGETPELHEEGVRMRFIGRRERRRRRRCSSRWTGPRRETAANDRITLFVAFNYGGRAEILDAAERFDGRRRGRPSAQLLYAPEMHDPDLIIRTSGEQRLATTCCGSRAYSELVFRDELWPDFYARGVRGARWTSTPARKRRFGGAMSGRSRAQRARRMERRNAARTSPRGSSPRSRRSLFAIVIVARGGLVFDARR